jgi:ATP-dependent DNA helicase RecQ
LNIDLTETFEEYQDSLGRVAEAALLHSNEHWRSRSLYRHVRALSASSSLADCGALLREILRLQGWVSRIPAAGFPISQSHWKLLERFGISIQQNGSLLVLFAEARPLHSMLPEDVWNCIAMDEAERRFRDISVPDAVLTRYFPNYRSYQNPTQKAGVRALLTMPRGAAILVTIPTGGGKSLLFELATLWWRQREESETPCILLVVPTIALAIAHQNTLKAIPGLEGSRSLRGDLSSDAREQIRQEFLRGEIPVLIASPEMLFGGAHSWILDAALPRAKRVLAADGHLSAIFVDEAHIIESWGRTFRPDFQRLPGLVQELRSVNPDLRVILLSATISDPARRELRRGYEGTASEWIEIEAQVPRYEFDLASVRFQSAESRREALLEAIDYVPRPAIVYTTLVEDAESLYTVLRSERGYSRVALFTGESSEPYSRQQVVEGWIKDEFDLVIATSAFGMGIDKSDVRTVIHACVPESAARYYQEIGRAGRDGRQALALCLWWKGNGNDLGERSDDLGFAYRMGVNQFLTVRRGADRWRALMKEAADRHAPPSFDGIHRVLELSLDAHPADMSGMTGRHNRGWNMVLLNQMQRTGALEILESDLDLNRWKVRLLDPQLLDISPHGEAHLVQVLESREVERNEILDDIRALEDILTDRSREAGCVLVRLFEAVESGTTDPDLCGRCWWCRKNRISPPKAVHYQLGDFWNKPNLSFVTQTRREISIIPQDDHYASGRELLVRRLANVGVEQFIVPDDFGSTVAEALAKSSRRVGFCLTHSDLLRRDWKMIGVPTALIFPAAGARQTIKDQLWSLIRDQRSRLANGPSLILYVTPREMTLDNRPAVQVLCAGGYCDERELDRWRINA